MLHFYYTARKQIAPKYHISKSLGTVSIQVTALAMKQMLNRIIAARPWKWRQWRQKAFLRNFFHAGGN